MTTAAASIPIATFQDILDAMAQNPELEEQMRRHLQDEDLRNLPQTVARLVQSVQELTATVQAMAERQARTEAGVAETQASQARLEASQARTENDVTELKAGQARLEASQARTENDVAELKASQARTENDVTELKAGQARLEASQARTENDVTELKAGQARLEASQARTENDVTELKAGQARLEASQARTENDVTELKASQARTEAEVAELKAGQARLEASQARTENEVTELKAGQARLETNQASMWGELRRLTGTEYERKIARILRRRSQRYFGITGSELVHSITMPNSNLIPELLDQAFDRDAISSDEADLAQFADIVIAGVNADGNPAYAVIEASITVDEHDVSRAKDRADIIARATNAATIAAVVGTELPDDIRQLAEAGGVSIVILAE